MNVFTQTNRIVVTCAKRLSPFLRREVEDLGYAVENETPTSLLLRGTVKDCIPLNLKLRCASQVYYSLKEFPAEHPQDIYDTIINLPWEDVIPKNGYLSVTNSVNHFTVNNSLFMNMKVKDAIMDRLREKTGQRPDSGPQLDRTVVHLFWKNDRAEIFIDTSGETLSKHGYRKIPGNAPMMEGLAAATLLATQWDRNGHFINPMCGSGTIAIEAALLATRRYPGLLRNNYGFMHLKNYRPADYENQMKEIRSQIIEKSLKISASDINPEAIRIAKINAQSAGVAPLIQFSVCDFEEVTVPPAPGVVFFNPEYGERLGQIKELESTYSRIGDFLKKKCQGYWGYIFTGNLDLAKKVGLKANRRIEFYTAKIDARLLQYELYAGTKRENA